MPVISSVGHSTQTLEEFLALLANRHIELIADVRRFPGSRRHPHFTKDSLKAALSRQGIGYFHLPELGGRRDPLPQSPNRGWQVAAFQGYADHMGTEEFAAGLAALESLAHERTTAYMCAEALWWRCHRRLLSDALVIRGWAVRHIMAGGESVDHPLTDFAVVEGRRLTYPPQQPQLPIGPS